MVPVTVVGRLTRNAEKRVVTNGNIVLGFTVANSQGRGKTQYFDCSLWGTDEASMQRIDKLLPLLTQGKGVAVYGRIAPPNGYVSTKALTREVRDALSAFLAKEDFSSAATLLSKCVRTACRITVGSVEFTGPRPQAEGEEAHEAAAPAAVPSDSEEIPF